MVLSDFKVNLVILATVAIIATLLPGFVTSLPPEFYKSPKKLHIKSISEPQSVASLRSLITPRADINYRLPNDTLPIHYDIELSTNVHNGDRKFTGRVHILLTSTKDTNTIVLHANNLTDFEATIKKSDQSVEYKMDWSYEEARHFLTLTPKDTKVKFTKGTKWMLTIAYKGTLGTDVAGFYMTSYTDSSNKIHYMATTQFEPVHARMAFPCYDEPAKRATFSITIKHDPSYTALSNMPVYEKLSSSGVTVFEKTKVTMPTYLVGFHVSDYDSTNGVLNSVPHRLFSKPADVKNRRHGLVAGMQILQNLAEYYKVPFDLPKIDQVVVPGKEGGMENWGLVTYGERDLLFNKTSSTSSAKTDIPIIVAHEFTHQWFGDHVTVRWWTYLWVKEGFAEIFSYEAVDEAYPEWDIYQLLHTDKYQQSLSDDEVGTLAPMTHYVQTPAEIKERYDSSSYDKPACVLYMWQNALGKEVFRSGLNKYLTTNAFRSAEEWQVFAALQSAVDEYKVSIPDRMDVMLPTWTQQSGYPLLTVSRDYKTNAFTVTQTAYNSDASVVSNKTYYVPFNYASSSKADFRSTTASHYLPKTKQITITDNEVKPNDWLILNKQATGFYRINYDNQNWHLLAEGLRNRPKQIHSRNRAQLLFDAFNFVNSERLDHEILLDLLTYLPGEDEYAAWSAAHTILETYIAYLSGGDDYDDLKKFLAFLVTDIYKTLGVNEVLGEHLLRKFTRNRAVNLACAAGVEACLKESNDKLKGLMNYGTPIEPDLKQQAYCNGLRKSSDNDYNYFLNDFFKSSDASYRDYLISALGCSETEAHLRKYISSSIDMSNSLTDSDRTSIVGNVYSKSSLGLLVSIDFLTNNWEAYGKLSNETGSENQLSKDIVEMSNYVNNRDQEKKMLALVEKVKNSNLVEPELEDNVKANMGVNFEWLDKNHDKIMAFVKQFLDNGN